MPTKTKAESGISPKGIFGYSHLVKPSQYGSYDVQLILEGDEAESFKEILSAASKSARDQILGEEKDTKKRKALEKYKLHEQWKPETDDEGEETGKTIFSFSNKAEGKNGKTKETFTVNIPIVDAKKKKLVNPKIGRGTVGKIAYALVPFAMASTGLIGVSLRLKAVQVLELVEYGGGGADAFSEEEGYEAPEGEDAPQGGPSADF